MRGLGSGKVNCEAHVLTQDRTSKDSRVIRDSPHYLPHPLPPLTCMCQMGDAMMTSYIWEKPLSR